MSHAYSMGLREPVIADCDGGLKTKAVAMKYSVSPAWVRRLKQHRRERGDIVPRTGGGSRGCRFDRQKLARLVAEQPDATLVELRDHLGVKVSPWAISKALRQLGLSFIKMTIHAVEQDRPEVAERRADWRVAQLGLDPGKLIFIDETWAKTNMTRPRKLRGRAPRGQRLIAKVPHGHWKTTTLIAALDQGGMRCSATVDGPVDADVFEAFCRQVLVPTLRPGDLVVMDNLSSHKTAAVRQANA